MVPPPTPAAPLLNQAFNPPPPNKPRARLAPRLTNLVTVLVLRRAIGFGAALFLLDFFNRCSRFHFAILNRAMPLSPYRSLRYHERLARRLTFTKGHLSDSLKRYVWSRRTRFTSGRSDRRCVADYILTS